VHLVGSNGYITMHGQQNIKKKKSRIQFQDSILSL